MLKKEDISIRAPEPQDVDFLYMMENDKRMWHLSNTLTPFSRFGVEKFVKRSGNDTCIDNLNPKKPNQLISGLHILFIVLLYFL